MKVDGRTLDHKTLEHLRITAVRRVVEDGEAPGEVMRSMGLCRTNAVLEASMNTDEIYGTELTQDALASFAAQAYTLY